jgi:nitrite reductase/ring-hydroxylating ferredoxin subunit
VDDLRKFTELTELPSANARLHERNFKGEAFLVRGAMQKLGTFDDMRQASLRGIRKSAGEAAAQRVEQLGFERTHEVISPADIPRVTDAAYHEVTKIASSLMQRIVPRLFGHTGAFYFERSPNVRFHIPYDVAAPFKKEYSDFGKKRGEGKITAHGPHRDSWLECPTNCVNVWVAVGHVSTGNGLLLYPDVYGEPVARDGCHIRKDANPGAAAVTAMEPGDAIIFHGDQVHGSVVNYSAETRHAVSFRLCLSRPKYRDLHIHDYMLSTLAVGPFAEGPLAWIAEVPAKIDSSYFKTKLWQVGSKLGVAAPRPTLDPSPGEVPMEPVRASDLQVGQVRAIDKQSCVTKLHDGSIVAFGRRCTHEGADLAFGTVDGNEIRCPWHNLPFDLASGKSPCGALRAIRTRPVDVDAAGLVVLRSNQAE